MRSAKTALMAIGAFVPVAYCGGLAIHFFNVGGSVQGVQESGLGPTVVGLGVLGMLFLLAMVWKMLRLINGPPTPGTGRRHDTPDDGDGFDADAAIARYMAEKKSAPVSHATPAPSRSTGGGGAARPSGFGRRRR